MVEVSLGRLMNMTNQAQIDDVYQQGFQAGAASRDAEVAELEAEIERKMSAAEFVLKERDQLCEQIASEARQELERLWGGKIFLELWVKVRSGWADDDARVRSFGYE